MNELEKRIKTYAFTHDCDLDKATRKVMLAVAKEIEAMTTCDGLFDMLFSKATRNQSG